MTAANAFGTHRVQHPHHHAALLGQVLLQSIHVVVEARQRHLDRLAGVLAVLGEGDALLLDLGARRVDPVALVLKVGLERTCDVIGATRSDARLKCVEVRFLAVGVLVQGAEALVQVRHQALHGLRLPDEEILHRLHLGLELLAHRGKEFALLVEVLRDALKALAAVSARGRQAARARPAGELEASSAPHLLDHGNRSA